MRAGHPALRQAAGIIPNKAGLLCRITAAVLLLGTACIGFSTPPAEAQGTQVYVDAAGVVRFPYGYGTPQVQCSPVHACVLMLQSGETVYDTVAGDTVRWQIVRGVSGSHADVPTIYLKPIDAGLPATNLVITTNRHTYDIALVAVVDTTHTLYGFYYPSSDASSVSSTTNTLATPVAPSSSQTLGNGPAAFDYGYQVSGPSWLSPTLAATDGDHTWLRMPADLHDAPAFYVIDASGAQEVVTVHRQGQWVRIDGDPAKIVIVSGAQHGNQQVTVEHVSGQ